MLLAGHVPPVVLVTELSVPWSNFVADNVHSLWSTDFRCLLQYCSRMFMFAPSPNAHMLLGHEVFIWSLMQAVSPNGTFFVTGSKKGLLHSYQIPVQPQKSEASSGTKLQVSNQLL